MRSAESVERGEAPVAASLDDLIRMHRRSDGVFVGPLRRTDMPRTYGGQLVAQGLAAAALTVNDGFGVHSLHSYFLRPGDVDAPVEYSVTPTKDGVSFASRRVVASQSGREIFIMSVSFHVGASGVEHQDPMPAVPAPEDCPDLSATNDVATAHMLEPEWSDWEIRSASTADGSASGANLRYWIRHRAPLGGAGVHPAGLAYISDMMLLATATVPHPQTRVELASLDHAMWFFVPHDVHEWVLYDQTSPFAGAGRGLTFGRFFARDGRMVGAVAQEGMTATQE